MQIKCYTAVGSTLRGCTIIEAYTMTDAVLTSAVHEAQSRVADANDQSKSVSE